MIELASSSDLERAVLVTMSKGRGTSATDNAVQLVLAGWKTSDRGMSWESPRGGQYRGARAAWIEMRRQAKKRQAERRRKAA